MNRNLKLLIGFCITFSIFGCKLERKEGYNKISQTDSTSNTILSSFAAVQNDKDTARKFIRTADLKFKVNSVIQSTYDIENSTNRHGGFVTYTNLLSNISNVTNTTVSADSSLETTYYTVTNSITLRIPNTKLDTTLKEISGNIGFLDYRIIKAEDVALQILSNNLTQKRSAKNEERLTNAIDNKGKKLDETTIAEEILLGKQELTDNAKISNLSLTDQIKFSTVNLLIYQGETIKTEIISNDKKIVAYEPGLGSKLFDALQYGWYILEKLIVFLANLWALFLLVFLGHFLFKKYKHKLNPKRN